MKLDLVDEDKVPCLRIAARVFEALYKNDLCSKLDYDVMMSSRGHPHMLVLNLNTFTCNICGYHTHD